MQSRRECYFRRLLLRQTYYVGVFVCAVVSDLTVCGVFGGAVRDHLSNLDVRLMEIRPSSIHRLLVRPMLIVAGAAVVVSTLVASALGRPSLEQQTVCARASGRCFRATRGLW